MLLMWHWMFQTMIYQAAVVAEPRRLLLQPLLPPWMMKMMWLWL